MTPKLLKLKKFSGPDSEQNRNPAHIIQVSQVVKPAEDKRCPALAKLEHISLMTMTIKTLNLSLVCLLALGSVRAQAQQQDTLISKSRASILVPRPALQPIKSLDPSSATPIDTLDTGNPAVKILLLRILHGSITRILPYRSSRRYTALIGMMFLRIRTEWMSRTFRMIFHCGWWTRSAGIIVLIRQRSILLSDIVADAGTMVSIYL